MPIPSPAQILASHGLSPKYSFGQNFLHDRHATQKIAELAVFEPGLTVLELGAGLGALTDALLARGCRLSVVERDRDLVPVLTELFADYSNDDRLRIIEADAKQVDFLGLLAAHSQGGAPSALPRPWVLAGNLPYQITGPLIEKTIHVARSIRRAVYLVQKEVAERLAASPGTKDYGALSVFVQAQFAVKRAFSIKAGAFHPRPRVDSAVVVLEPRDFAVSEETPTFRLLVKSAFSSRRKTLKNAWKSVAEPSVLEELANCAGFNLEQRGETLFVEQFALAANRLALLQSGP